MVSPTADLPLPPAPDALDAALLDRWQRDFPIEPEPFQVLAAALATSEADVLARLGRLAADGRIGRIGAVVRPNVVAVSTLAALAAPPAELDRIAALVAARPEVNHCYAREHELNLWFVAAAIDRPALTAVLDEIAAATGCPVLDLPIEEAFHIDLGFALG